MSLKNESFSSYVALRICFLTHLVPLRQWVASMSSRHISFNTRRFPIRSCSNPSLTTGCVRTWGIPELQNQEVPTLGAVLIFPWPEDVSVPEQREASVSSNTRRFTVRSCSYPSLTTGCVCTWASGRHPWAPKPRDFDIRSCSNPSLTRGCVVSLPEKVEGTHSSKPKRCPEKFLSLLNYIYGPECYIIHLTDRCRFLNCSVRMGGGGWGGIHYEFRRYFWGEGGGERCVMNHNGPFGDRNRCVMNS